MNVKLYETLTAQIPETFQPGKEKIYFGAKAADNLFEEENGNAKILTVLTETPLEDADVANQIGVYQQYYSRMAPGFVMGELRMNSKLGRNVAILTYKSNAPTKDLFNILALTTLEGKELLILLVCDMADALENMTRFMKTLESLEFAN